MLGAGLRHADVAEHLGVSHDTIDLLTASYRVRGIVHDLPRSGRRQFTPVQYVHIRTSHLQVRF